MRKSLGEKNSDELLLDVRALRKRVENLNPEWDTSKCKACEVGTKHGDSGVDDYFEGDEGAKVFKPANGNFLMVKETIIPILGGDLVGGVIDTGVGLVSGGLPVIGPVTGKNYIGIIGGVALAILSPKISKNKAVQLGGVAAGAYLVAKNVMEVGNNILPIGATRAGLGLSSPSGLPHIMRSFSYLFKLFSFIRRYCCGVAYGL